MAAAACAENAGFPRAVVARATTGRAVCWCFMCPADDIPNETPSSESQGDIRREERTSHRGIGPESEVRGGPEAPGETLEVRSVGIFPFDGDRMLGERVYADMAPLLPFLD